MPQFAEALTFTAQTVATSTTAQALFGPDIATPLMLLPSNAKTIIFLNLDGTDFIYLQMFSTPQNPLPTLTSSLSLVIPPNAAITLDIGPVDRKSVV